jgi:hypothetical protein
MRTLPGTNEVDTGSRSRKNPERQKSILQRNRPFGAASFQNRNQSQTSKIAAAATTTTSKHHIRRRKTMSDLRNADDPIWIDKVWLDTIVVAGLTCFILCLMGLSQVRLLVFDTSTIRPSRFSRQFLQRSPRPKWAYSTALPEWLPLS